jgi:hypothetical protein
VKLDHLYALTDANAVLQHATFTVPAKREGYTVDDNARALVFAAKAQSFWPSEHLTELQRKLLAFILLMQSDDGKLHNLMDFSQRFIDEPTVGDHLGRAIWSAGAIIHSEVSTGIKNSARRIFDRALPWGVSTEFLRTKAYTCLGLNERLQEDSDDQNLARNLEQLANDLLQYYYKNRGQGWNWFEDTLTYDNARLSQALFAAYQALRSKPYLDAAEESLAFLIEATTKDGRHVPIGNNGWYSKRGKAALYDQQPVDAGAMVETSALAYRLTSNGLYENAFRQTLGWFYGLNTKSVAVYDVASGGCYDGITPMGLNENQGSESTISFLLGAASAIENLGQNM